MTIATEPQQVPVLADVLAEHQYYTYRHGNGLGCVCNWESESDNRVIAVREWSRHVDSEFWAARTVTTAAQLDALPEGTIISIADAAATTYTKRAGLWDGEKHPRVASTLLVSWTRGFRAQVLQLPEEVGL